MQYTYTTHYSEVCILPMLIAWEVLMIVLRTWDSWRQETVAFCRMKSSHRLQGCMRCIIISAYDTITISDFTGSLGLWCIVTLCVFLYIHFFIFPIPFLIWWYWQNVMNSLFLLNPWTPKFKVYLYINITIFIYTCTYWSII